MPEIYNSRKSRSGHGAKAKKRAAATSSTTVPSTTTATAVNSETSSPIQKIRRSIDDYSQVMSRFKPSRNPLLAFAAKPLNVCFDSQLKDEQIILLMRQHPITQLRWILIAIGLLFAPLLFGYVGMFSFLPVQFVLPALVGWYLLVIGFVMEGFLLWFFNVYIITDERIIDVDFYSLIYKNISAAKIDNIEDISATTGGALRSIFDFGTVRIQTAAAVTEFEFADVPHPNQVITLLNEMLIEEEREKIEGRVS